MDRRLKIVTLALCVVYLVIIGGSMQRQVADFVYGFKQGIEEALKSDETGSMPALSATGTFFLSLKPESGLRTFPSRMLNQLDRTPMKAEIESVVVEANNVRERLPKGTLAADVCSILLSFLALFITIVIPVQTFYVVRSITKNKIFDSANIHKLRIIGYALLTYYVATFAVNFLHYRIAAQVVQVDGYSLRMNWENITLLLLGLVVLMFAELLKVSVQLKEEQDLTV